MNNLCSQNSVKFPGESPARGRPHGIRENETTKRIHTYVYRFMVYEIVST